MPPIPTATSQKAIHDDGGWLVSKDVVSVLRVLLKSRRLAVAQALPAAEQLLHELTTFQAEPLAPTADVMLDWRENPHDDLVLAIAIAAWLRQFWASFPVELAPGLTRARQW